MSKYKSQFSRSYIFKALFSIMIISVLISSTLTIANHIYQKFSPTSWWFAYKSIEPVKWTFHKWEILEFETDVTRYHSINVRREDTAYCTSDLVYQKYPTQYRPNWNRNEYKEAWHTIWTRLYYIPIDEDEHKCKMCGTVIWTTDLWYNKIYTYCTKDFLVNMWQAMSLPLQNKKIGV